MSHLKMNEKAPSFSMESYDGKFFELSSFKGKSNILVVLNRGFV